MIETLHSITMLSESLQTNSLNPLHVIALISTNDLKCFQLITRRFGTSANIQFKFVKINSEIESEKVDSMLDYKKCFIESEHYSKDIRNGSLIELDVVFPFVNVSMFTEHLATIVSSMLVHHLFKSRLSTALRSVRYPRKECIFVLYQIARIECLLAKFTSQYCKNVQDCCLDESLLQKDLEWNLIWIHLVRLRQIRHLLWYQIINKSVDTLDVHSVIDALTALSHSFSCYYRHCKILVQQQDHRFPLIIARIKLCWIILKEYNFYFHLFNLDTLENM